MPVTSAPTGAAMGFELPRFDGPLAAFRPGGDRDVDEPIYMGGDLHATHPEAPDQYPDRRRDPTLDNATITFAGPERESLGTTSVEGIWCLALPTELLDSSSCFMLCDGEDRLRIWLLLPPAEAMLGVAHLWLPAVPRPCGEGRRPSTGSSLCSGHESRR
ncbi:MAG: hypothetical protein H0X42_07360 [Solirubrobacterales bacterium]|nr:hypothetical protein [Solirubrobacterales bacterium]